VSEKGAGGVCLIERQGREALLKGRKIMKQPFRLRIAVIAALLLALSLAGSSAQAQAAPVEYQQVLDALGKKGDYKANVLKVNIPRSDLKVTVDGVAVPTPFGFGGWLAMTKGNGGNEVMMGDLVLLEDEVNPVMSALLDNGLQVTALHNHFFWETPRIFYMHVHGMGNAADLARMVKPAVDLIGHITPHAAQADANAITVRAAGGVQAGSLDTAALNKTVGATGEQLAGGVYKFTLGRDDLKMKEMGATINARMGLNTWAAFYGSDENAIVAGDVAMTENEVTPVLKSLRAHGLNVVAIHHHMTGTKPMVIFLHYWGKGRASSLAEGFRAALNELGKGRKMEH
jgi:hypothetical protein